jgi:hypothetical protein
LRSLYDAIRLGASLAQDQLGLALRLLARFGSELLRRYERLVQCLISIAKAAQLFRERPNIRFELLVGSR